MERLLPWERLLKRIIWLQLGEMKGKRILDFGSGLGVTASRYAKDNQVIAIEQSVDSVNGSWREYEYEQIIGSIDELRKLDSESFDVIFCHNVLEYVPERSTLWQK